MATTVFGYFVFSAIAYGGYIFMNQFDPLSGPKLECAFDIPESQYAGVQNVLSQITSYEKCMEVIPQVFAYEDANKNGLVERCEDANFQVAMGSTKEYATKFSG